VKLAFFGTPDDAVPALRAVVAAGHEVPLVVTQPDRRRGRGGGTAASPVKEAATDLGLEIRTPERARDIVEEVRASGADVGVVVAFGQLLTPALLAALPHGFVNVHFSLLPRWRGAAPVERALLAGDAETGVCIMQLDEGMDTGPVYECVSTPIGERETAGELRGRLVEIGAELLLQVLPTVAGVEPRAQRGDATLAPKLTVDEFRLDPYDAPAVALERVVRAGNPRPGAWIVVDGRRVRILGATVTDDGGASAPDSQGRTADPGTITRAAELVTVEGSLRLDEVQPEGRRPMSGSAWRTGQQGESLVVEHA